MFTWEEAGLLRQMLQVLFWVAILVAVAATAYIAFFTNSIWSE